MRIDAPRPRLRRAVPAWRLPARALLLAAAAFALGLPAAQAQSLQELYGAARSFDATYLAARALNESAAYRVEQFEALNRPTADLTASLTRDEVRVPGFGYGSNTSSIGLTGSQPLFNRANDANIAQARLTLQTSAADLELAEQDLILRLSQAYFDVLGAQDTLATTRTNKAAIAEQLASAKRNFEVGTATITDTREAQARFDLATAQEIGAENDLVTKSIALDQLVGRRNVKPLPLATPVSLPVVPGTIDEWVARADGHPRIRQARVAFDTAQLETDKARAGHLPTVAAIASLTSQHGNQQGIVGTQTNGSVGVQINVPLFSGYSVQNRIKETLVLEDRYRNELDVARRSVTQATRQAYYGVLSQAAQVRALEAAESSSALALEATQLGYRVGVRVNIDVLNAQTQLYTTRRDLAKARYDVLLGNLQLRQAAGELAPGDVEGISRLLGP